MMHERALVGWDEVVHLYGVLWAFDSGFFSCV